MKKILLIVLCFAFVSYANAQFKIGLRGGITASKIKMDDISLMDENDREEFKIAAGEAAVGFHFGAITQITLGPVFIQPELLFSSTGGDVKVKDLSSSDGWEVRKQKYNKLDIPLIAGYKLGGDDLALRLQAGPLVSVMLTKESVIENMIDREQVKEDFKNAVWGYQVGVGVDVWKLGLDVKYEGNFSKIGEEIHFAGRDWNTDSKTNQWVFSVAYFF